MSGEFANWRNRKIAVVILCGSSNEKEPLVARQTARGNHIIARIKTSRVGKHMAKPTMTVKSLNAISHKI